MNKYKVTETQQGPVDNMSAGHYEELLVQNYTSTAIVIINKNNDKSTIPPLSHHSGEAQVEITYRRTDGPRHATNSQVDIPIPTQQISVRYGEILVEPIYISEVDLVVCTPDRINSVSHPRFAANYEDAISRIHSELSENLTQPALHILANDPTGVVRKLYISIEGVIREVTTTNYPGESRILSLLYPGKSSGNYNKVQISLEQIEKGNGAVNLRDRIFYVGMSKNQIDKRILADKDTELELFDKEDLAIHVRDLKESHTKEINTWKQKYDDLTEKYNNLNNKYNNEKESLTTEITQLKAQLADLQGILDSREKLDKARSAELGKQKAEIGVKGEEYKMYGTVAKIALPVLISVTTYLLLDKKKD